MAFLFRMASRMRPSTPEEVVRSIKDSFLALPTKTGARVIFLPSPPPFLISPPPIIQDEVGVRASLIQIILGSRNLE